MKLALWRLSESKCASVRRKNTICEVERVWHVGSVGVKEDQLRVWLESL